MSRPGPVLRVALFGITATVVGFAVIAAYAGWHVHAYWAERHRATVVVAGTVVEDGIGDGGDIRVRWADRAGHVHRQRFAIYDTGRYRTGRAFPVAYDPSRAVVRGFPADPDESAGEDDYLVPLWLTGPIAAGIPLAWAVRGLRFRWAARRPGHPAVAVVYSGDNLAPLAMGSTWISLAPPGDPGTPHRWQRVLWHDALDSVGGPVDVTVHGAPESARRAVVELADGTRLVPFGRRRRRPPRGVVLTERADRRATLAEAFILPAGTPTRPGRPWWQAGVAFVLVGAVAGTAMGFVIGGGGTAVLPFAAGMSATTANVWALAGGNPAP